MFCLRNLWLIAAVVVVTAFSARAVYEELDQDVPYIVWPTMLLQWAGYALMAYVLYSGTTGASPWLLGGALLFLVAHSIVETWYLLDSALWTKMLLLVGVMGFAAAAVLPSNKGPRHMVPVIIGAITIIVAHTVVVPAEDDRRIAAGPGMALMMLGWLMLGMTMLDSPQLSVPLPQSPLPTPVPLPESLPQSPLPLPESPLPLSQTLPESPLPFQPSMSFQPPVPRRQFSLM